jgi:hypothetical protein
MLALAGGREVGLNVPAGDDFAAWSMAALAFLGPRLYLQGGEIIRVGLVLDRLQGPHATGGRDRCALVVGTAAIGFFAWQRRG